MKVNRSSYYAWLARPAKLIPAEELHLYRRAKALFKRSRASLGYRELCKNLRKEGFKITRYKTRKLMAKLNLVVKQRVAYRVTTKRKHSDAVADNLLNQNFNPVAPNQIWAGDVTLKNWRRLFTISKDLEYYFKETPLLHNQILTENSESIRVHASVVRTKYLDQWLKGFSDKV
ncbi:putative transposase [Pseudoalteromonas lipolytica LMEB 39]|nr:putative transposase [Pseudoalteromonas lipolytica LMEB 39]